MNHRFYFRPTGRHAVRPSKELATDSKHNDILTVSRHNAKCNNGLPVKSCGYGAYTAFGEN